MSVRVEHIGDATLYCGDCREVLPGLSGIDAVVTSPPYDQQRKYGSTQFDWKQTVCGSLSRVSNSDAQILVNLGLVHRNGVVSPYWDALISEMREAGWRLFGWYVWDQLSGLPGDWNGRLAPSFEFIFHFNRSASTVNKTKRTLGGKQHGPNMKAADGNAARKSHEGRLCQPFKIPDSVIRTPRETGSDYSDHPARFPISFASELIEPFSDCGATILDPFMGSGTTGVACVRLGRRFVGVEVEAKYFEIALRRIEQAQRQKDLFVNAAPAAAPAPPVVDLFAEVVT